MMDRKEDMTNFLGTAFLVVFFLFISLLSNKPVHQTSAPFHYNKRIEVQVNQEKAVIVNPVQLSSVQKSCLNLLYNRTVYLYNQTDKVKADNNNIAQQIGLVQNTYLLIKPILHCRLFYPDYRINSEDLPILS